GFAVPVHEVNRVVPQIIKHGKLFRPGLGISIANQRLMQELNLDGLLVLSVESGSSAEKAGIRGTQQVRGGLILGDIIVAVNGEPVKSWNQLRDEVEKHEAGESVTLTLQRDNGQVDVTVTLEAM
ncbi:PDZ domain-containing protein, partial [Desulfobulbus sp. F1]|nr:PDZ domain-containing protein [Desulfobulbus sp. F1]